MKPSLKSISEKFAMKLGLQSRPSSGSSFEFMDDEEDIETDELPPDPTSTSIIESGPGLVSNEYLNFIAAIMHDARGQIALSNYPEALNLLGNAKKQITDLENIVALEAGK